MKIEDISDRIYQGKIYRLLDEARSSIVISMYLMLPQEDPAHPVNRLMEDLIQACGRGVKVTIYLNTKFKGGDPKKISAGPVFERLRAAGGAVRLVSPVRRLHDKLVIIDERFVVEGSMNWSVSAIADNLESATLIESPELAQSKLRRIGFFPLWGEEAKKTAAAPENLFPAGAPTSIEVPVAFIEDKTYIPQMISEQEERAIKLLLLLIYVFESKATPKFQLSLESAAEFLEILPGKSRGALRRQMIRVTRSLAKRGFLRAEFRHGKQTWVELLLPKGDTFTVGSHDLSAGELAALSDNEIFLRLIGARLRSEGKKFEDLRQIDLKKQFSLSPELYQQSRLKRKPLEKASRQV